MFLCLMYISIWSFPENAIKKNVRPASFRVASAKLYVQNLSFLIGTDDDGSTRALAKFKNSAIGRIPVEVRNNCPYIDSKWEDRLIQLIEAKN